ncbi:hypothetical protein LCGC14_1670900 [marine sediment metagenome]|uniref:Uncharacterized protein n=1 Tax=marine sediment metagenome TaxID=412755 RepID=A0A0F9IDX5_9ZZZZ
MPLNFEKQRDLLSRTISMVRDFLMEEVYHDTDDQDLAEEWGTTYQHVRNLTTGEPADIQDLLQLLSYTFLDFGLIIHDPATGKEVTFFAAENLASHLEYETQTEEIQHYGSDKKGEDPLSDEEAGLDFLPLQHSMLFGADGQRLRDKPIEIECDGDFDTDKELGKDTIEAEFSEITEQELLDAVTDMDDLCEYCLDHLRIAGSMLCHYCIEAGIVCPPGEGPREAHDPQEWEDPERPEDYEPLELLAAVDRRAQRTQDNTIRLLQTAGMLNGKGEN